MNFPLGSFWDRLKKKADVPVQNTPPQTPPAGIRPALEKGREQPAAPIAEKVSLEVADFAGRIPELLLSKGPKDRKVWLELGSLKSNCAQGKPKMALSELAKACPDLFANPIRPEDDVDVFLPWRRLRDQVEQLQPKVKPAAQAGEPAATKPLRNIRFGTARVSPASPSGAPPATATVPAPAERLEPTTRAPEEQKTSDAVEIQRLKAALEDAAKEHAKVTEKLRAERDELLAQSRELREQLLKAAAPAQEVADKKPGEDRALPSLEASPKEKEQILKPYRARCLALAEEKRKLRQALARSKKNVSEFRKSSIRHSNRGLR